MIKDDDESQLSWCRKTITLLAKKIDALHKDNTELKMTVEQLTAKLNETAKNIEDDSKLIDIQKHEIERLLIFCDIK